MSEDRFRTRVWEDTEGEPGLDQLQLLDAEMDAEGYVLVTRVHWPVGRRGFRIRLYERRPPTVEERLEKAREAADELDEALGEWFAFSPWVPRDRGDAVMGPGDIWLRVEAARQALREAVEREQN